METAIYQLPDHVEPDMQGAIEQYGDGTLIFTRIDSREGLRHVDVAIRPGTTSLFYSDRSPVAMIFRGGAYRHDMAGGSALVMFDPRNTTTMTVEVPENERLVAAHMSVDVLHRLLRPELHDIPFLRDDNADKTYHTERPQTVEEQRVLYQLDTLRGAPGLDRMIVLARTLELFYYRFAADHDEAPASCPFLSDEVNVERIRTARSILTEELREPPKIRELARRIGMNETHLKSGFKRIYGSPIYSWVVAQKMHRAMAMLESGQYNVNEVADAVGYSNVSQFIAAFRKRHGITPGKVAQRVRDGLKR